MTMLTMIIFPNLFSCITLIFCCTEYLEQLYVGPIYLQFIALATVKMDTQICNKEREFINMIVICIILEAIISYMHLIVQCKYTFTVHITDFYLYSLATAGW